MHDETTGYMHLDVCQICVRNGQEYRFCPLPIDKHCGGLVLQSAVYSSGGRWLKTPSSAHTVPYCWSWVTTSTGAMAIPVLAMIRCVRRSCSAGPVVPAHDGQPRKENPPQNFLEVAPARCANARHATLLFDAAQYLRSPCSGVSCSTRMVYIMIHPILPGLLKACSCYQPYHRLPSGPTAQSDTLAYCWIA